MRLTEKDKMMLEQFTKKCEQLATTEGPEDLQNRPIKYSPRKYKLTDEEKAEVPAQINEFIRLYDVAIATVTKHIPRLKKNGLSEDEWEIYETKSGGVHFDQDDRIKIVQWLIEDLQKGLGLLQRRKEKIIKDGIEEMIADLERSKRGRRPGLGLSRGFGEILWIGYDWQDEIMAAIDDIEDYYNNM